MPGLQLQGFNNLTKTLSFNSYDIGYAATPEQQERYIAYLDEAYNSDRLTRILQQVAAIIGASILNIARQDYEPRGASVTLLVAEEPIASERIADTEAPGPLPDAVIGHLDKSHITVHTYPDTHPDQGISTFRVDIDVSTCGRISPLKALNYLIHSFESDLISIDYRVRGFTRDVTGKKHFIDHPIHSIQHFLSRDTGERYQMIDVNVAQEHIFHTRMLLKDFALNHYLFGIDPQEVSPHDQAEIERRVRREMAEIFYGGNSLMADYRYHVFFCTNLRTDGSQCCRQYGAQEARDYVKQRVKALGPAIPDNVRINSAGCLDRCAEGPVIVIYPEATWYTYVDRVDLDEIIEEHLVNGRPVDRLRI